MRPRPLIVAHRGGSGPAPSNTIDAFEHAIRLGADMIEFDVRRTADRELVVFHDEDIGGVLLSSLPLDGVVLPDAPTGRRVPRLADALDALKGRVRLDVELKESGDERRVLDALFERGFRVEDFVITAFDVRVVESVKRARPEARAGLLVYEVTPQTAFEMFAESRADFLGPDCQIIDEPMLRDAETKRVPLLPWTVNEPDDIRRLLTAPAVFGVITDRTAEAVRIRESVGR